MTDAIRTSPEPRRTSGSRLSWGPSSGTSMRRRYSSRTAGGAPSMAFRPWSTKSARSQNCSITANWCETMRRLTFSRRFSAMRSTHFAWKSRSPTARTSSTSRISDGTCAATANPRRTTMPVE